MKRLAGFIFAFILLCGALPVRALETGGVEQKNVTIGGKSAALIYVNMDGSRTGELTIGSHSVNKDMPASQHVSEIKAESGKSLIASVNGGFFNSYYDASKPLVYPENCAQTYALLIDNGEVIVGSGETPMIGFTEDGKVLIDRVTVTVKVGFRDTDSVTVWGVNKYFSDPNAVMLFTDKMGYSINIPAASKLVYIKNNIITKISSGGTLAVPEAGTKVLVYNSNIWANSAKFFYEPREGNYARVTAEYLPDRADTAPEWEKVTCAVGSGPWLLQGGKDVTSRNGDFSDPKLAINKTAARSFAAVMGDGRLLLGVATASFRAIADYLMSIGAKDALALDGGASSTLYVEGGGYPRPAGRKLSNMLHIVDYASGALPQPADAPNLNLPSPWAEKYIADATGKNLIPEGFEPSYQKNITREEFCELVIQLIKLYKGDKYSSFIYLTGVSYEEVSSRFIDTYNLSVLDCSRLKIIDGAGGGRFDPNGSLTRQQAAKILKNVAGIIGVAASGDAISFDDQSAIASWAAEGVDFVSRAGIMNGKGPIFDPKGYFTKQEAVVTILRLLRP